MSGIRGHSVHWGRAKQNTMPYSVSNTATGMLDQRRMAATMKRDAELARKKREVTNMIENIHTTKTSPPPLSRCLNSESSLNVTRRTQQGALQSTYDYVPYV